MSCVLRQARRKGQDECEKGDPGISPRPTSNHAHIELDTASMRSANDVQREEEQSSPISVAFLSRQEAARAD